MKKFEHWLDRLIKDICDWLNNNTPGKQPLAAVGETIAGQEPAGRDLYEKPELPVKQLCSEI